MSTSKTNQQVLATLTDPTTYGVQGPGGGGGGHDNDSLAEAIRDIVEAEADIAECLADFLCDFLEDVADVDDLEERAELVNRILCSFSCKEKAMGELIDAVANLVNADNGNSDCNCGK